MFETMLRDKIQKNYIGFWGIPNTYHSDGRLVMFDTKEEAVKYYLKRYTNGK